LGLSNNNILGGAAMNIEIFKIAANVGKPISLTSVIIIVLYLIYLSILRLTVFSKLTERSTFKLIRMIADRVFFLSLVALLLGVGAHLIRRPERISPRLFITGNVFLADGLPVKGAMVIVDGVDRRKETDSSGWFQIEVDEQESWVVRASYGSSTANSGVRKDDLRKPVTLTFPGYLGTPYLFLGL